MNNKIKVFTGNSNVALAKEITYNLNIELGKAEVTRFSDGEINLKINESVRNCDVFVIQSLCNPVNDNLMELLIMLDALKRASANTITAVIPYFGYARQDRKMQSRDPISAKLVANLIEKAGATRILTIDLHSAQIQGFFDIPVDNLTTRLLFTDYYKGMNFKNLVIVAPDLGDVKRIRKIADSLNSQIVLIDKRRPKENVAEAVNIVGEVKNKTAIMVDDIVDTAGTLTKAAAVLAIYGAKEVHACCTHAVLSGDAIQKIKKSPIEELLTTNTIPVNDTLKKIKQISVAPLLAEAIKRIHDGESVSSLFEEVHTETQLQLEK